MINIHLPDVSPLCSIRFFPSVLCRLGARFASYSNGTVAMADTLFFEVVTDLKLWDATGKPELSACSAHLTNDSGSSSIADLKGTLEAFFTGTQGCELNVYQDSNDDAGDRYTQKILRVYLLGDDRRRAFVEHIINTGEG